MSNVGLNKPVEELEALAAKLTAKADELEQSYIVGFSAPVKEVAEESNIARLKRYSESVEDFVRTNIIPLIEGFREFAKELNVIIERKKSVMD